MDKLGIVLGLLSLLAAVICIFRERRKTRKTMDALNRMLDAAIEGSFAESVFDESRLSSLETKFAHYFSASSISARNVAREQGRVHALISDISHQTKTPISNILLYSELLMEAPLPPEARENAAALHRQGEKLRFLIDALVKLSRLENGILTLSPKEAPLRPMLEDVVAQYAPKAREKGLALTLEQTALTAQFDPKWTAEALGNLVDNAIKYTRRGTVSVSATGYPLFTRIDVTDSGDGIPEESLSMIFSRFYRGENARDREGVGIGLYLTREILSGEGGYLKVASTLGQGSTFSVFLPK